MIHQQKLDLTSFGKAITSLEIALNVLEQNPHDLLVRDASMQRFKYTYELCHKMLKRYLELTEPNAEEIDQMQFAQLIRTGSERGLLLNDWETWSKYRYARNLTSYTYNEAKAVEVCQMIPAFHKDAKFLLERLHERN